MDVKTQYDPWGLKTAKNEDGLRKNRRTSSGNLFFDRLRQPDNLQIEAKLLPQLQLGFTALRPCLSTSLPLSGAIVPLLLKSFCLVQVKKTSAQAEPKLLNMVGHSLSR